jgi:hypothetical protein
MGAEGGTPQMQALEGLKMIEKGAQLLSGGLPGMGPQLMEVIMGLRNEVPQQLAQLSQPQGGVGVMPTSLPPQAVSQAPSGPPPGVPPGVG